MTKYYLYVIAYNDHPKYWMTEWGFGGNMWPAKNLLDWQPVVKYILCCANESGFSPPLDSKANTTA